MLNKLILPVIFLSVFTTAAIAQDSSRLIADVHRALGDINSLIYSGSAKNVSFQQCGANASAMICGGTHDPMRPITDYSRVLDLNSLTSRHTGATMNVGRGGSTTVSTGTFFQQVTSEQTSLAGSWASAVEFYITPWGFLKGAETHDVSVNRRSLNGQSYQVLSWTPEVVAPSGAQYLINAYINSDNLIEHVETWLGDNMMGDMHIMASYTDWRDFGGFVVPTKITQTRGGWPYFDVDVIAAKANIDQIDNLLPAPVSSNNGFSGAAEAEEVEVITEKLGDGLYRLTTGPGSYDSVIVEFDDHIMLLEAGANQRVIQAYMAKAKALMLNKPIRYVMVTHPHADHTAGLPAVVAEGATIITHENNQVFFERALNTPRTLLDDALASNSRQVWVETVADKAIYSDGKRTVEMYHIYPAPHSNGLIVAYIPKEKILFQGDFSLPAPGQPGNAHVQALVPALIKHGVLDFERYINVHASAAPQTKEALWQAVGK